MTAVGSPSLDAGTIMFMAAFETELGTDTGIWRYSNEALDVAIDRNTLIPDTDVPFTSFIRGVAQDDGDYVFRGGGLDHDGIYASIDGTIIAVADTNTAIPNGTGTFTITDSPSIGGGHVVFQGDGEFGQRGIYASTGFGLKEIIAAGDLLDGKPISTVSFHNKGEGFKGASVAFLADFADGSSGIYVATVNSWFLLGDMDIDKDVDFDDIDDFILALNFPAAYEALHGVPPFVYGDMDQDGNFDFDDIDGFVAALRGSAQSVLRAIPEPSTFLLLAAVCLCAIATRR